MKRHITISCMLAAVTALLASCSNRIEAGNFAKVAAGDRVPAFEVTDLAGRTTYNSSQANPVTMLYLFWSECKDCKQATPAVIDLWKERMAADNSVQLVCIARGGDEYSTSELAAAYWDAIAHMADPSPMPPLYYDEGARIFHKFASQGVPRFCVVDTDGIIRWHSEGPATYEELLTQLNAAKLPLPEEGEE